MVVLEVTLSIVLLREISLSPDFSDSLSNLELSPIWKKSRVDFLLLYRKNKLNLNIETVISLTL
jgi:hypothetical protein